MIAWFAGNHVAANLLAGLIVVGGLLALTGVKQEVFPEVRPDVVTVSVVYPGATPEEIERGICIKVEEEVQDIDGIDRITSTAAEGAGAVSIEFLPGTDIKSALNKVKSRVDAIDTFPEESEKPVIREVVRRNQVIDVVVSGPLDERELKRLGENVRDDILAIPGITYADLVVARPYEIAIEVSEDRLREYGLTFDEVAAAVRRSSLDIPGGSVKTSGGEILLRTVGQAYRGPEFKSLVLRSRPDGTRLLLGDVANVVDGFEETDRAARFDDEPAVVVQVFRVGQQKALDVSRKVHEYVDRENANLPGNVRLTPWNDDARILRSRIDLLVRNGIAGFVLVFLILAMFLKLRLAFWVAIGIPISFLGAIWLMPTLGVSVNLISLFAFIVVLGLAVDDAIVMGESIYWEIEKKKYGVAAAITGAARVYRPVIFGVLTTVAAFSPMLFLPGATGKIWRVIPMIVIPTLLFSLVESLFVLPAHLSTVHERGGPRTGIGARWQAFQDGFDRRLRWFVESVYRPSLELALQYRYTAFAIGVATVLITAGFVGGGLIKFQFFPSPAAERVVGLVTMPLGTPRAQTEAALARMEEAARTVTSEVRAEYGDAAVKHILVSFGEQPYRSQQRGPAGSGPSQTGEHVGEVDLELAAMDDIELDADAIARRWRELVGSIPDALEVTFTSKLFTSGEALNFQLSSNRLDELQAAANELKLALNGYPGVTDVTDTWRSGKDEIKLQIRPQAEALGLSLGDLGRQVRQAFYGLEAQRVQRGRDEVKVMVRLPESERRSLGDLERLRVRAPGGVEVPFGAVAIAEEGRGFSTISRADRARVISVTGDVDATRGNSSEITAAVREKELPRILANHPGVTYSLEGEQRQQSETLGALRRGFLLALFAIFALLAIPLRSYSQPIIIMSAIPFGFAGAIWGHMILGMPLTMLSAAGFVALSGVVVNDSLVMVDYVNRAREEGADVMEASRLAGVARFRAILLTSLSTFAGVTPLLLERSLQAQFLKPLAVSLGFGVMFATFVTLVLVPVWYAILHDVHDLFGRIFSGSRRHTEAT
ncbi:MAG: efflux RND transporter permease subunit [bacterium]